MKFFIANICLLTMLSITLTALADDSDGLVLAGERIGHAQLYMDRAKLEKLLGEPTTSSAAMGRSSETWCSKSPDGQAQEVDVYLTATDPDRKHWRTTEVVVTSPFFHTPAGVTTQSEPTAIWQEFPDLRYVNSAETKRGVSVEFYGSLSEGIGFVIERFLKPLPSKPWGKCLAIVVFPPGKQTRAPYLGDWESR